MRSGAILLVLASTLLVTTPEQTKLNASEHDTRYVGVVTGTNVYVRSNPRMDAYPCPKVHRPAQVTVV